jgi:hypothetical protein
LSTKKKGRGMLNVIHGMSLCQSRSSSQDIDHVHSLCFLTKSLAFAERISSLFKCIFYAVYAFNRVGVVSGVCCVALIGQVTIKDVK